MKLQKQERLREMQLAFVGKLLAGLSHEFKNHLAIIKESSGLIEDLLLLQEPGQPADSERYKKIIAGINERIAQAAEMCRFLSAFSHRMDHPIAPLDVTDVLQEEMYLLRRFARQKQVDMTVSFGEDLPVLLSAPSLLQFALYCMIWPALESLEPGGRILIAAERQGGSVKIVVHPEGAMKTAAGETTWRDILPEVLRMLGAESSRRIKQDGNEEVVITISASENPHGSSI